MLGGRPAHSRTPRRPRRVGAAPIALAVAVLIGIGIFFYLRYRGEEPPLAPAPELAQPLPGETSSAEPSTPEVPETPAVSETAPPEPLPRLDESDAWLRAEAGSLSASPALAGWLASGDLVRRFVASVDNVAEGESPRAHLPFLVPREPFRAVEREGRSVTDPRSFARFDAVATVVASLDAERCAALYRRASPLVDEAFRALGPGSERFDERVARAIRTLLEAPVPTGQEELVRPGVFFEYADPALESLDPAQKHLLRMGPENARKIQAKLRELAAALGIDTTR